MGDYLESNLIRDEAVVKKAELHKVPIILCIIDFCVFLIIAIVTFIIGLMIEDDIESLLMILFLFSSINILLSGKAIIKVLTMVLGFTNKRLIGKIGLISTHRIDIPLNKADSTYVTQGILGRILGYGTIIVSSVGSKNISFIFIKNPGVFRSNLLEQIENDKKETG